MCVPLLGSIKADLGQTYSQKEYRNKYWVFPKQRIRPESIYICHHYEAIIKGYSIDLEKKLYFTAYLKYTGNQ